MRFQAASWTLSGLLLSWSRRRWTRRDVRGNLAGGGRRLTGQEVEVVAFGLGQAQGAGEGSEDLRGGRGGPAPFQTEDIVHGQSGELCELFAAQPWCPADAAMGEAEVRGAGAVAPVAQGLAEGCRTVVHPSIVRRTCVNSLVLADPPLRRALPVSSGGA